METTKFRHESFQAPSTKLIVERDLDRSLVSHNKPLENNHVQIAKVGELQVSDDRIAKSTVCSLTSA
jgi:hypothetical protein